MRKSNAQTYYRVLYDRAHYEDWYNQFYFSTHAIIPPEWDIIYKHNPSTEANEYPLECSIGIFRRKSVDDFIAIAQKYDLDECIPIQELIKIKLAGVCAFSTPQAALSWGKDGVSDMVKYVVFLGEYLCPPPEHTIEGVVARVLKALDGPLPPDTFRKKYLSPDLGDTPNQF